ncbi:MAG: glycoside hydrolase family 32 protein, partial [Chloroflexota bacterium]|nr:glycoside hydrolase family 32 protein [Chloroflexota bacterium]
MTQKTIALQELFRPLFHFSPPANWLNDPNGLVYYAGEYHLFYQYHPHSAVWGPMHWGHAVSRDLVQWQHLPIALYPDELGMIFSGSAVIDWQNTAGFGKEAMIALFTHDRPDGQRQSLAYSTDQGRTWTKYAGNPLIDTPPAEKDFRDPKVIWYAESEVAGHWVMLLAVGDSIWFYTSPTLLDWTFVGEFGSGHGAHDGVWETPELFKLPVDDGPELRWVLAVGVGEGATIDRLGTQYFVGAFDGATFTNENAPGLELWADYGTDFYAAQAWNDAPDQRQVWLAWLNNWRYARTVPTAPWRGVMSLPRAVSLRTVPAGIRLVQQPVDELKNLRTQHTSWHNQIVDGENRWLAEAGGETLEIMAEF